MNPALQGIDLGRQANLFENLAVRADLEQEALVLLVRRRLVELHLELVDLALGLLEIDLQAVRGRLGLLLGVVALRSGSLGPCILLHLLYNLGILLIGGWLSERYGHKRVFRTGVAIFLGLLASVLPARHAARLQPARVLGRRLR